MIFCHLKQKLRKTLINRGFSLIEAAIALIVIGLLSYPLMHLYTIEIEQKKIFDNIAKFNEISDKINSFVSREGRYPIPSSLVASFSDADYGEEAAGVSPTCVGWPGNSAVNGTCISAANNIIIGAVPFKALGITPDNSYDLWSNKILYAVPQAQATAYVSGNGNITAQGFDAANNLVTLYNDVDIILISHGEAMNGAYTREGMLISSCPNAPVTVDAENCDMDDIFTLKTNETTFPEVGSTSHINGVGFYDDLTFYQRNIPVDLWMRSLDNSDYALTFSTRIGIGTPDPQVKIHVLGDIRANNIQSDSVCKISGACFDPDIIAGVEPNMDCGNNGLSGHQPVLSIASSKVNCASPTDAAGNPINGISFKFPVGFGRINCADTGKLMTGIDGSGDPICVNP